MSDPVPSAASTTAAFDSDLGYEHTPLLQSVLAEMNLEANFAGNTIRVSRGTAIRCMQRILFVSPK
jgi:hypothetical protein